MSRGPFDFIHLLYFAMVSARFKSWEEMPHKMLNFASFDLKC